MLRATFVCLAVVASLPLAGVNAVAAEPTLREVYQATEAGNYRQAQSMMDQVLKAHPNSAKAHFVEAQLLAKEGHLSNARAELVIAERLEPALPFASPGAIRELKGYLNASGTDLRESDRPVHALNGSVFPWAALFIGLGFVALIALVVSLVRRRSSYATQGASPPGHVGTGTVQPYGTGAMGPVGTSSGGLGSGTLGGLATGAAVGAGVVAGEALMHRVFDGHRSDAAMVDSRNDLSGNSQVPYDMGGEEFGVSDASSWDDSFGAGGSDWS